MVTKKKAKSSDPSPGAVYFIECLRVACFILSYKDYWQATIIILMLINIVKFSYFLKHKVNIPCASFSLLLPVTSIIIIGKSDFFVVSGVISIFYDIFLAEISYARQKGTVGWAIFTFVLFAIPAVALLALAPNSGGCRGCVIAPGSIVLVAFAAAFILYGIVTSIRWIKNYAPSSKGPSGRL